MRVLIIPEDPTLDQHVLRPVVQRIFDDLERKARVEVLSDPHLSGIAQALNKKVVADVVQDNRMIDLFLLIVDRDCERFANTQKAKARMNEHREVLIATLAREEVEVWPLALHRKELGVPWSDVQEECDPKEAYFDEFIEEKGWRSTVGKGRKRAMRTIGQNWPGLLQVCPEIAKLKEDVREWLERAPT